MNPNEIEQELFNQAMSLLVNADEIRIDLQSDSLVRILANDGWFPMIVEDLVTGLKRSLNYDQLGPRVYNEMEALAWMADLPGDD